MRIHEVSPETLQDVPDDEVLNLHHRVHQLWGLHFEGNTKESAGGLTREDLVNAHRFLVEEMRRRGMHHNEHDGLDRAGLALDLSALPEKLLVIDGFVAIVGSTAAQGYQDGHDVDVLLRAERNDRGHFLIGSDNVHLPLRKALDPEKRGLLHFIDNPQGPHGESVALYDLVLLRRPGLPAHLAALDPRRYRVMKPSMAGYTEFFSVDELWDAWAKAKIEAGHKLLGSAKIDGFRTVLWGEDGKLHARFEDSDRVRTFDIRFPEGVVLEGEFTARRGGEWLARTQLAGVLAGRIKADPHWWLYDLLVVDVAEVHTEPFDDRYRRLQSLELPERYFTVLEQRPVTSKERLEIVGRWAASHELSEGLFVRQADAPYHFGSTDTAAKLKTVFEIKVTVLDVIQRKNGHVYRCGLREPPERYSNVTEFEGHKYLDLGNTFVTRDDLAKVGDTLNVRIEELIDGEVNGRPALFWGKPTPVGPDESRPAYTVAQAIDLAKRGRVYKQEVRIGELANQRVGESARKRVSELADQLREDTREERAAAFWREHWHESFPTSGRGEFVYHHHWRGLSEDEARLDEAALLQTDNSVHGDLRCSFGKALWGFTVFLGRVADLRGGRDLPALPPDDKLQGTFKLHQPTAWLMVARRRPYVSAPGDVGSASRSWAKFFEVDHGTYEVGVWREHFFEIFLHGSRLKGRYLIQYAPVGRRGRVWLISKPEDQRPYAETHELEDVVAELRRKGQQWLIWGKPGEGPRRVDVERGA